MEDVETGQETLESILCRLYGEWLYAREKQGLAALEKDWFKEVLRHLQSRKGTALGGRQEFCVALRDAKAEA